MALLVLLGGPGVVWADSPPLAIYSAAMGTSHEPAAPGWMATGENINDRLGISVASAGDVNNDGYDDLVAAAGGYPGGVSRGRVYVYHGGPGGPDTIPERTLTGEADNDQFGFSVAGAGDVNGDGYGDLLVGAYQNDQGGNGAGKFYLYYGSAGGVGDIPAFTATGEQAGDSFGWRVAAAGDVNGDSYDDVLVTAPGYPAGAKAGRVYLFYGSASGLSTGAMISITGEANLQEFGNSAAGAGDVNGDGFDDIIVGAYRNDDLGPTAGKVYLYYGSAAGLDVATPTTITGENFFDRFGYAVSTAGDVNGDGYADVLVGATDYALGSKKGKVYVYLGSAGGLTTTPAFTVEGEQDGDELGWSMDTAGDMNGDGYADILIGAPSFALNQVESPGRAYVYYGGPSGLYPTPAITVTGAEDGDQLGFSVASAGDVNGDGQGDILIGANKFDNGGQSNDDVGVIYLYYGILEPRPADIGISLWVEPTSGPAGSTVTYTIAYSNVGELAATDVVITDVIPVSL
ncbi:FG-GAP-like repeat-containing protein, partial [Litorilinea aerophila]|uniref:FG-GAP-like repeat-containing protein n=1 Tax=Litorilinea aerophila TaxID=1204385 RepID=UPI001B872FC9